MVTRSVRKIMHDLWRTEPDGILSVDIGGFRLIVQAPEKVGGLVRFMVLRHDTLEEADVLIGSGNEGNVRAAMVAAERMAKRYPAI